MNVWSISLNKFLAEMMANIRSTESDVEIKKNTNEGK